MGKQGFGKDLGWEKKDLERTQGGKTMIWEEFRLGKQGFGKDLSGKDLDWENEDLERI